jgi:hypothetical protein
MAAEISSLIARVGLPAAAAEMRKFLDQMDGTPPSLGAVPLRRIITPPRGTLASCISGGCAPGTCTASAPASPYVPPGEYAPHVAPGDFSFRNDKFSESFLDDAYKAVTAADLWDWLRDNPPPEGKGFMFWGHPNLKEIEKHMKLIDGHSGSSYGWTMRNMQVIAEKGWDAYVATCK